MQNQYSYQPLQQELPSRSHGSSYNHSYRYRAAPYPVPTQKAANVSRTFANPLNNPAITKELNVTLPPINSNWRSTTTEPRTSTVELPQLTNKYTSPLLGHRRSEPHLRFGSPATTAASSPLSDGHLKGGPTVFSPASTPVPTSPPNFQYYKPYNPASSNTTGTTGGLSRPAPSYLGSSSSSSPRFVAQSPPPVLSTVPVSSVLSKESHLNILPPLNSSGFGSNTIPEAPLKPSSLLSDSQPRNFPTILQPQPQSAIHNPTSKTTNQPKG
ncbi:unnamed protein product [Ambrosiozyma monospora]|uniref:Unnamed protein product n=1 Tax=Ambrosiozyma monospora TaxID=43982 RepID=A0ACB5UA82_AMBMO|nr:unnamed protein product [Ambrosiozyma monospora]